MIIVDASVALAWCLADEADEYADRMLERVVRESAAAPAHWPLEVANGLRTAVTRRRMSAGDVPDAARLIDDLGIEVVAVELTTALWTVLDTALEHGLSAYDAVYLDLARHRGLALATIDSSLRSAAERVGVLIAD